MEFCWFLRSVTFVVRLLGQFMGRGVCVWLKLSHGSRDFLKNWHISSHLPLNSAQRSNYHCGRFGKLMVGA